MKKLLVFTFLMSLLAMSGLAWSEPTTAVPQPKPTPSIKSGSGVMGLGGGPGYNMRPGMMGPGYGMGMNPNYQGWQSMSPKDRKAWRKMYHQFQLETLASRKKLVATQLDLETLWNSPNPDHAKVQEMANDVASQQAELAKKRNRFLVRCRKTFGDRGWACPGVGAGY